MTGTSGGALIGQGIVGSSQAFIAFPEVFGGAAPSFLDFGPQAVGIKSQQTVTLTNTGASTTGQLNHIAVKVTGPEAGDFIASSACAGASLRKSQSCKIVVTFDPLASGNRTASLMIADESSLTGSAALNSPQVVELFGSGTTGGKPGVKLSASALLFSTQLVSTTSAAQTVTLTNTGTATLLTNSITISGDFAQTHTCGTSVAAGKSCTISVKFTPLAAGPLSGTLSIFDNATGSPQKVTLNGTGTIVSLSPEPLNFPTTLLGKTSAPENLTLKNTGKTTLSTTGKSITGDFHLSAQTCTSSLAAGKSCTYSIVFKPTAKGQRTGTFNLTDNGGGSPQKVTLVGLE